MATLGWWISKLRPWCKSSLGTMAKASPRRIALERHVVAGRIPDRQQRQVDLLALAEDSLTPRRARTRRVEGPRSERSVDVVDEHDMRFLTLKTAVMCSSRSMARSRSRSAGVHSWRPIRSAEVAAEVSADAALAAGVRGSSRRVSSEPSTRASQRNMMCP